MLSGSVTVYQNVFNREAESHVRKRYKKRCSSAQNTCFRYFNQEVRSPALRRCEAKRHVYERIKEGQFSPPSHQKARHSKECSKIGRSTIEA